MILPQSTHEKVLCLLLPHAEPPPLWRARLLHRGVGHEALVVEDVPDLEVVVVAEEVVPLVNVDACVKGVVIMIAVVVCLETEAKLSKR